VTASSSPRSRAGRKASGLKKVHLSNTIGDELIVFDDRTSSNRIDRPWFVYLLPLMDCSAFKVGFSCHPLQRMLAFSSRYFERFDLRESVLLQLDECDHARNAEAELKSAFAEFRVAAPEWLPMESGGHTEWFSAVHLASARAKLTALRDDHPSSQWIDTVDYVRNELATVRTSFEGWACHRAQQICTDYESVNLGYTPTVGPKSLHDWFDAYRFFEIPIFKDDAAAFEFVRRAVRLPYGDAF
jgi:hypothetical protein